MALRWRQKSRRIYVRPRTGPQSAHLRWLSCRHTACLWPMQLRHGTDRRTDRETDGSPYHLVSPHLLGRGHNERGEVQRSAPISAATSSLCGCALVSGHGFTTPTDDDDRVVPDGRPRTSTDAGGHWLKNSVGEALVLSTRSCQRAKVQPIATVVVQLQLPLISIKCCLTAKVSFIGRRFL